ncbi:Cap15 family cyclic dinucleotide receptor domain-containing protein [Methylorubrum populi]
MYPLLPWKLLGSLLTAVVASTLYADKLAHRIGVENPDGTVIRLLPMLILALFTAVFAPTGYWAPWRIIWRIFPSLNRYFPDLNGVWVGITDSNWPTISKLIEAAKSQSSVTEVELHSIAAQQDAIALRITNSLFKLRIGASLSSTGGESQSITAKPWRHQHTERVHLSYVYRQYTPNHSIGDEEEHLGAADLVLAEEEQLAANGTYWTRRSWKTGRNTAGMIKVFRLPYDSKVNKTLHQYATEHMNKLNVR